MKNTLAVNKQLFNVKNIAYSTNVDNLTEGQFGIFADGSETSIADGASLPEAFRLVSMVGGKMYYSFDTISKAAMSNTVSDDYQAEQVNIWETTIENCSCIKDLLLRINIDERTLEMRDGLTWAHSDFVVQLTTKELECLCDSDGNQVYENNVLTGLVANKVNDMDSPFYEAEVTVDVTGVTVYADAAARDTATIPGAVKGDLAIITDVAALTQFDGTAYVVVGTSAGLITDVEAFSENNKDINTDADQNNDGLKLQLVIKGKVQDPGLYRDLEVNYVYPRGVRIKPALIIDGYSGNGATVFTETQAVAYERNAGYDLRAEEFDNMNYYTDLNYYPQLTDGIAGPDLVFQFENGKNYDVVNFEFVTDKVNKNDGDKRLFGVLLAAEAGSDQATDLKAIFTP